MATLGGLTAVVAQDESVFGGDADIEFAGTLWRAMSAAKLVGENSIRARPYAGTEPHGSILVTLEARLDVNGRRGPVLVKKNYRADDISVRSVASSPREILDSITVMYQREDGYDPANDDWFWVKYGPGGTILENQKHTKLAGRVAKGADVGCLACHRSAPGGDYVFGNDYLAEQ